MRKRLKQFGEYVENLVVLEGWADGPSSASIPGYAISHRSKRLERKCRWKLQATHHMKLGEADSG